MILLVALSVPASAEPAVDTGLYCGDTSAKTVPAAGAVGVPTDLAPLLIWDCSPWDWPVAVTLGRPGAATAGARQEFFLEDFRITGEDLTLEPVWGPLEPDTAYEIRIEVPSTPLQIVPFTTGSGPAPAVTGETPGIRVEYASQVDRSWSRPLQVELLVQGVTGPFATFLVEEGGQPRARLLEAGRTTTVQWRGAPKQPSVCLTVQERDSRGVWHGPSPESCVDVARARGCLHTPPRLAGGLLLPLLLLARRRR